MSGIKWTTLVKIRFMLLTVIGCEKNSGWVFSHDFVIKILSSSKPYVLLNVPL